MSGQRQWFSEPCFLGIGKFVKKEHITGDFYAHYLTVHGCHADEAGRGPVLGPMVYACAFAPIAYRNTLTEK